MAKTTAPKSPAKSSAGAKGKSKRPPSKGSTSGNNTPKIMPTTFPMPTGAFTVEQPPDPGPKRDRHTFAKIPHVLEIPNLIELQKASFAWFKTEGLAEAFASISPIKDFTGNLILEFGEHSLGEPKYTIEECRERDMTYSAPLRVRVRLITAESGEIKGIPDQEIFMGDFPLMTDKGTFMINGAERVIVSQLVRSPGVYYSQDVDTNSRQTCNATIIPNRGAWIEFETDNGTKNDITEGTIGVRIDKNRKIYVSTFIRALTRYEAGPNWDTDEAIFRLFEGTYRKKDHVNGTETRSKRVRELIESLSSEVRDYFKAGPSEKLSAKAESNGAKELKRYYESRKTVADAMAAFLASSEGSEKERTAYRDVYAAIQRYQARTQEVERALQDKEKRAFQDKEAPPAGLWKMWIENRRDLAHGLFEAVYPELDADNLIVNSVGAEKETTTREDSLKEIYKKLRPGEPENAENAEKLLEQLFFDEKRYDLAGVGRYKLNGKFHFRMENPDPDARVAEPYLVIDEYSNAGLETPSMDVKCLTRADMIAVIRRLMRVSSGIVPKDDIDHLGNRRVRSVGELLQNQFRVGLLRLERVVRERMTVQDIETVTPQALINIRPVVAAIKEFFGSSQLSQFMDQTNSLAELTHKRRLSALGPGGLSRERAGFEVRDVHHSHYGRICPIETPEGPNIGLIGSLATYGRVNRFGFIETPYRVVTNGTITDEIVYLTADREDEYIIAQANTTVDASNNLVGDLVVCRYAEEYIEEPAQRVQLMDVSPKQIVSIATALIPFLEHDDANRALMGANMQRQAVPLLRPDAPIVGTGMEYRAAKDSGSLIVATEGGLVSQVDAKGIVVKRDDGVEKTYDLLKFVRSNAGTCINQRPIVSLGDTIVAGQVIADGPSSEQGELALGQNVLVGFMPWEGYNYEDAILISERMVKEDRFTSIHIEEYECEARDTKLGPEEITRDIPNVGEDALKDLDERGIIRVGAEVRPEDILVGKVTPKGETELTAEERLLRAIFGEKSREVRDTSLKVPHGEKGKIIDVKVFSRENGDELSPGVNHLVRVYVAQKRKILQGDKMAGRHGNKGVIAKVLPEEDMPYLEDGSPVDIVLNPLGVPSRMNLGQIMETHLGWAAQMLGMSVATPVFDGAHSEDIAEWLQDAGLPADGKTWLRDGRTGERFSRPITVGLIYMLKLAHLVDDKIHARSTGPYSMITQQPLGGKAQFGGQRFGEMEVWALEAYGAAYTLQELLTVKSDDVIGRVKTYEAIVKGENVMEPGVPESFKVLIKELQSLALDVKVLTENREEVDIKSPEDEMGESERREFGLLMGDEQPLVSQTQVAAREAVAEAVTAGVLEGEVAGTIDDSADEEEEEEELDDSKPLDAVVATLPVVPPLARGVETDEIFEEEDDTAKEEVEEGVQGYELEEEEDEVYEEDRPSYEDDEEEPSPFAEPNTEEEF
jgi:DNA-directed RNA polymerase subunit beta